MTTIDQGSMPTDSTSTGTVSAPVATGCGLDISGGALGDVETFAKENSSILFWTSVILGSLVILLIFMMLFGYVHFGTVTTSTYTSTFVPKAIVGGTKQNFGNYPNWYMQDGCAGYNCQVDTSSGRSLGFGVSDFHAQKSNFGPSPSHRQHLTVQSDAQRQANEEILRRSQLEAARHQEMIAYANKQAALQAEQLKKESMVGDSKNKEEEDKKREQAAREYIAARTLDEVGGRQARTLSGCHIPSWDPMATEEARVLGAVGAYRTHTPAMSSFSRAVNDNIPLTDAQLEAIMQGGEPYTIAPAGIQDLDALSAQQRSEVAMMPPRRYV